VLHRRRADRIVAREDRARSDRVEGATDRIGLEDASAPVLEERDLAFAPPAGASSHAEASGDVVRRAPMNELLPQSFYERDPLLVARELLGKRLRRGSVVLRITEVEAYVGPEDSAAHARHGRTARNAPMWGPGGHAYVYLCYGIHQMLNVVVGPEGLAAAVLVRACEPEAGHATLRRRRGAARGPALLTGPGKVAQALGIDTRFSGRPLFRPGGLELRDGEAPPSVLVGPRIGIDYATERDREAAWRFASGGSVWVSFRDRLASG
jgi:DNA-3-methyladenine glycosylase